DGLRLAPRARAPHDDPDLDHGVLLLASCNASPMPARRRRGRAAPASPAARAAHPRGSRPRGGARGQRSRSPLASGWYRISTTLTRLVPFGSAQSIVCPTLRPSRALPIGASTEIFPLAASAEPG